jgi:hypothetical protein
MSPLIRPVCALNKSLTESPIGFASMDVEIATLAGHLGTEQARTSFYFTPSLQVYV